jgi:hypothetical protein
MKSYKKQVNNNFDNMLQCREAGDSETAKFDKPDHL